MKIKINHLVLALMLFAFMLLASCKATEYGIAAAKITHKNGKLDIELMERLKPMPDTTVQAIIIKKILKTKKQTK